MPLYEYKCHSCGKKFEVIQKFSDEPLLTHAECGGPLEKLLSPPAIQFQGTGWYVTDYGKGNGKPAKSEPSTESKPESKSDSATSTASESKSTTKTESKSSPNA